jgi:creatinine amidohydrolase
VNYLLESRSWNEVPERSLVLIPLGSTEQHGPHLPFSTDTFIAEQVAVAVAEKLSSKDLGPVMVAPSLAYGASGEHQAFPGTVSIGQEALAVVLVEMIRSVSTWGQRIVLVNGHGGNVATVQQVVDQMRFERHDVMWTSCALETPNDAHAGHDETSVVLYLLPESVRLTSIVAGNRQPLEEILPDLIAKGVRPVSHSGVLGDPTTADATFGEEQFALMVARIVREIEHE